MLGKKKLSLRSCKQFAEALKLKGDLRTYFELLVEIDDTSEVLKKAQLRDKLAKTAHRLQAKSKPIRKTSPSQLSDIFKDPTWIELYAALGSPEKGASLQDISQRTGISESNCQDYLWQMEKVNLLSKIENRFFQNVNHQIFDKLDQDPIFFKWFHKSLNESKKLAQKDFSAKGSLFFSSIFSVDSAAMPTLRNELREIILKYVDESETPEGDKLARLTISFHI